MEDADEQENDESVARISGETFAADMSTGTSVLSCAKGHRGGKKKRHILAGELIVVSTGELEDRGH